MGLVIVAAGASRRMRTIDKVWAPLGDQPVIAHSILSLAPHASAVALVVRPEHVDRASHHFMSRFPHLTVVPGGPERRDSVALGLAALPRGDVIAVHDAARPLVPASLLRAGLELLRRCDAAIPVEPLHDTIKEVDGDGRVARTLAREHLFAAQTPQLFRSDLLRMMHERAQSHRASATDDAVLLEQSGYAVHTFPGHRYNFKITTEDDLRMARCLVRDPVTT